MSNETNSVSETPGTALSEETRRDHEVTAIQEDVRDAFLAGVEAAIGAEGCGAQYDGPSREYAAKIRALPSSRALSEEEADAVAVLRFKVERFRSFPLATSTARHLVALIDRLTGAPK